MLADLYQITMAEGYWKLGKHRQRAVFDLFFRENPFQGGYAIFCGLANIISGLSNFYFTGEDIRYLETLKTIHEKPLFDPSFLEALKELRLSVNIDAMPEGSLVFPKEPLLRVEGPLWECQLLETYLLNCVNFSTLIATKSSRVCLAAAGDPVIEFGLRRAQGPDGGLSASRAAYIGGTVATSNVLAGQLYGIPVSGTHAHSWVMSFDTEFEAFHAYAKVMPNNCMLLVDTYNTQQGIQNAIEIGLELKNRGYRLQGIRLDSGDLATLSIQAREQLDAAGLKETQIVGSNDLDEYAILRLKAKGAKISIWGVGTRLVTAYDQPSLGGVYKLVAIEDKNGEWQYKAKHTDDSYKKSWGGIHNVRRFKRNDFFVRDVIYNVYGPVPLIENDETSEDLLRPIIREGKLIYETPSLVDIRKFALSQLEKFPDEFKQLKPTMQYSVLQKELG